MATNKEFAAISCVHAPFQREESTNWLLNRLSTDGSKLTDFIILGDLLESSAASVHPDEHSHTLADEYEAAAGYLTAIQQCLPPDCRLHWLLGNHDDNLQVSDSRRTDRRTRDLIHWSRSEWSGVFGRWKQYPYIKPSVHNQRGCLQIGQVIFCHGWDAGQNSDELESLQVAYACGGHSHRLVVRGHTHRPRPVSQCKRSAKVMLPYWYANAGTMGPLQPQYMSRKDVSQWNAGIVWGSVRVERPSRLSGVQWQAQTEIMP